MVADPLATHISRTLEHDSPFICCRFDPTGRYVFGTAEDRSIQRWDLASAAKTELRYHDSWIYALAFLPDGETLISGGGDGRLVWWPATTPNPKPQHVVEAHKGFVRFLAVSPDGKVVASGGNDNIVRLWNAVEGTLLRELVGHEGQVYSMLFHPSGEFLLSGDLKGEVRQWEVKSGKYLRSFAAQELGTYHKRQKVHYGGVRNLSLSVDGKLLACCGLHKATNALGSINEPLVLVFDWQSGEKKQSLEAMGVRGAAWRVVFHPQGFLVGAIAGGGGMLIFWNPDETEGFHRVTMPSNTRNLDLHPDSIRIATADSDSKVRISRMAPKPEAEEKPAAEKAG